MTAVERATLGDVDALVEAWVDLAADQRRHGSHLLAEGNREAVREAVGRHVMTNGMLVAREDDELVGFVMYGFDEGGYETDRRRGVLRNAWVRADRRREGIGSRLFDRAERDLADRGADVVTLEVMADNDAARRLYRRRGYLEHRVEMAKDVDGNGTGGGDGAGESDTHTN